MISVVIIFGCLYTPMIQVVLPLDLYIHSTISIPGSLNIWKSLSFISIFSRIKDSQALFPGTKEAIKSICFVPYNESSFNGICFNPPCLQAYYHIWTQRVLSCLTSSKCRFIDWVLMKEIFKIPGVLCKNFKQNGYPNSLRRFISSFTWSSALYFFKINFFNMKFR